MASAVGIIKMSNELIFDTLQHANKLKAAGVPEKQAEAQVEMMREIVDDKLATKKDLALVRKDLELAKNELRRDIETTKSELKQDIEATRYELKRDMKDLELRMTLKLGSIMVGGLSMLVILMKLFKL
ncbi:conserved hypothetical protein [Gammaproteobacteria bacterium]